MDLADSIICLYEDEHVRASVDRGTVLVEKRAAPRPYWLGLAAVLLIAVLFLSFIVLVGVIVDHTLLFGGSPTRRSSRGGAIFAALLCLFFGWFAKMLLQRLVLTLCPTRAEVTPGEPGTLVCQFRLAGCLVRRVVCHPPFCVTVVPDSWSGQPGDWTFRLDLEAANRRAMLLPYPYAKPIGSRDEAVAAGLAIVLRLAPPLGATPSVTGDSS